MAMVNGVSAKRGMVGLLFGLISLPAHAQVIQQSEVVSATGQQIQTALEKDPDGLRLDRVFYRDDLSLPDGKVSWKIPAGVGEWRAGRQSVPVEVTVNGKVAKVVQVTALLKQSARYLVLKRPLKRGDVVTDADLKWEESELDRQPVGWVDDPKQVVGQSASRQLQANRPLQSDWFSAPQVVARGERVQVVASRGALQIESTAIAKSAGRVGETITMENPASHKKFDARITGPGRAEVLAW
ncbi:MAG: flagellar basal body P-ring formation protein FlgA [Magnetococcales bacterium]|nr:flagellar basal body P-ring formation protein FlgA [Magnetococcales bacterium]